MRFRQALSNSLTERLEDAVEPACMVEGVGVEGLNFRLSAATDWRRLLPPRLPASIRN